VTAPQTPETIAAASTPGSEPGSTTSPWIAYWPAKPAMPLPVATASIAHAIGAGAGPIASDAPT
jgi:hypothetical protein